MRLKVNNKRIILFALILFSLPALAIFLHGKDALGGVTWGYKATLEPVRNSIGLGENDESADTMQYAVNFGVYDPGKLFADSNKMDIEHLFIAWSSYQTSSIMPRLQAMAENNRWPLITIEPWPDGGYELSHSLFQDILGGQYDQTITTICGDLKEFNKPLFVRWGHEMENVTGRYPWAQLDHEGYAGAYRYFVDLCRSITDNIFYVWSPVGDRESSRNYWPGRPYADYVGVSVYGFPERDMDYYGRVRWFDEIFAERYARLKGFDRPIMIAELGVTGSREHQQVWMDDALASSSKYPLLKTIIYFNAVDSELAWESAYEIPDWRIDPRVF